MVGRKSNSRSRRCARAARSRAVAAATSRLLAAAEATSSSSTGSPKRFHHSRSMSSCEAVASSGWASNRSSTVVSGVR
jgi:hypothetical protein